MSLSERSWSASWRAVLTWFLLGSNPSLSTCTVYKYTEPTGYGLSTMLRFAALLRSLRSRAEGFWMWASTSMLTPSSRNSTSTWFDEELLYKGRESQESYAKNIAGTSSDPTDSNWRRIRNVSNSSDSDKSQPADRTAYLCFWFCCALQLEGAHLQAFTSFAWEAHKTSACSGSCF